MQIHKGVIIETHKNVGYRSSIVRTGKIERFNRLVGNRKNMYRNGRVHLIGRTANETEHLKNPRQEPLEHAWKKLNT